MAHRHTAGGCSSDHAGDATQQALTWALIFNGGFLVVEVVVGLLTGSLALLSDAAHMTHDVGALVLALGVARLARKPASPRRSYGYRRAEVLGALASGVALIAACAWIVYEAVERLDHGAAGIPGWPVLVVAVIGLAINLGSAWSLYRADSRSLNVRGALLHMLADAAGSAGAAVAALFMLAGFPAADAVVSLVVGALALWAALRLVRDAARVLLEFATPDVDPEAIRVRLLEVDNVRDVHDLHVWSLDGDTTILSTHVLVDAPDDEMPMRLGALLREEFAIGHTTVQVECAAPCPGSGCALSGSPRTA